mgnify:CR=1 FL=1
MSAVFRPSGLLDFEKLKEAFKSFTDINELWHARFSEDVETFYYEGFGVDDFVKEHCYLSEDDVVGLIKSLVYKPFDLLKGLLVHLHLLKCKDKNESYIVSVFHHIIMDGICVNQYFEHLSSNYNSLSIYGVFTDLKYKSFTEAIDAERSLQTDQYLNESQRFWHEFHEGYPLKMIYLIVKMYEWIRDYLVFWINLVNLNILSLVSGRVNF